MEIDATPLRENGWVRVDGAVPAELCERLVGVLESDLGVPVRDDARWGEYGGEWRDLVPIWGHQAQWEIRQHPQMHRIWAALWGTEKLWVSLDSCRFTPPWRPGYAEPYGIHWDSNPHDAGKVFLQGVLALTDTQADQGSFRCVPSLWKDRDVWPKAPIVDENGEEDWLADVGARQIVHVPARAGDLIVWDSRLAHGNSKNLSAKPRLAFYLAMGRTDHATIRRANVESWETGRCVPWWRGRPGYDRIEPWPPAQLTELGRRLLGLDDW